MSLEILKEAIEKKAQISFEYNKEGKIAGERVGNAHAVFIMCRKDGSESTKVDVFQTGGVSDSGQILPSFRMFDLFKLSNIVITEPLKTFEVSDQYNPESDRYKFTIAKI